MIKILHRYSHSSLRAVDCCSIWSLLPLEKLSVLVAAAADAITDS